MKITRSTVAAFALAASLTLAGCSGASDTPSSSPSSTTSSEATPTVFPFKEGEVNWKEFSKEVGTANQAIKTLHVKNTNTIKVGDVTNVSTAEGDVDQSNPNSPSYSVKMTEGEKSDVVTELMAVDGALYMRRTNGDQPSEGWVKYPSGVNVNPVSTSTSLFKKLAETEGAVTKIEYKGKDSIGHKFVMSISMAKLVPNNPSASKAGDVPSEFWLDDNLRMVKQTLSVKTDQGESSIVSEQSNFNKPVKVEAPKDAKDAAIPSAAPTPSAPAPSASPSSTP